jgi:hypothetical protein
MLWFIDQEPLEGKKLSEVFQADRDRLEKNESLEDDVAVVQIDNTAEEVAKPYSGARTGDLHVVAHAGLEGNEGPWIAGMPLAAFVAALKKKFTPAGLEGATIWLLVCAVGAVIDQLAGHFADDPPVRNVTLYAPTRLMFISQQGIPHVHDKVVGESKAVDDEVARANADFMELSQQGFRPTGWHWAGGSVVDGEWQPLASGAVGNAVKAKFDPDGNES